MKIDKNILDEKNSAKLEALNNKYVADIVEKYINLCKPEKVTVLTDSDKDIEYVRRLAIKSKEEKKLAMEGHTIHFDGYNDQGRDKENTMVLLPKGKKIGKHIKTTDRDKGLKEIFGLMDGIMEGKEMLVCFFCLGMTNSEFSIPALQITDSSYVAHSETILYRKGYEEFKRLNGSKNFFHFIHSAGKLDERGNSVDVDKRRIYIDLEENRVLTINNQYAGNSVGLKKLSLRLAISKAKKENWLSEHMMIMGVKPEGKNRTTYFTGAFPSACGKTATAMIPGQTIIGDDIAYIKPKDGKAYAVNAEKGIFGIIEDVNPADDPLIYKTLTTPRELIFSNILVKDGKPYWLGMGKELPENGFNFSGEWKKGNKDEKGNEILPAHKNARYTIGMHELENVDPRLDDPEGVPISGIIYGGRDSDTNPPVFEALDWSHGVFIGASLESETTAATLGKAGVRKHNPMANLDFLVIPLETYIKKHLDFEKALDKPPKIFATNYFLKENGEFLNSKLDKKVWLIWMEGRIHDEFNAIKTPVGFIPRFEDLKILFKQIFNKEYKKEDYEKQFSIRIKKLLERLERMENIYEEKAGVPEVFNKEIEQQRERLEEAKDNLKKDIISPFEFI